MSNDQKKCKFCQTEIDKKAKICPQCGKKQGGKLRFIAFAFIAIVIIASVSNQLGKDNNDSKTVSSDNTKTTTDAKNDDTTSSDNNATDKAPIADTPEPTEDSVPTEYKSALTKAKQYDKTTSMSKQALYDQLVSEYGEKFSAEAAQYAIDNINANWNENALKKAEQYQSQMSMSPDAIYDQLVSEYGEKFTAEEATYAIQNLK